MTNEQLVVRIEALESRIRELESQQIGWSNEKHDDPELAALAEKFKGKPVSLQYSMYVLALKRATNEATAN